MNDPHVWWYVTRASGMVAWALLTLSAIWGVLLSTRVLRKIDNPGWLHDLHRWMGGAALLMTGMHMISLMLDSWASFSAAELLVPFAAAYRPAPVALGIVAFYLLAAVQGSSLLVHRLPRRFWKGLHYTSYASVLLVSFHAGWSGSDASAWGYQLTAILLILLLVAAALVRIITPGPGASPRGASFTAREPSSSAAAPSAAAPGTGTRAAIVRAVHPLADGVVSIQLAAPDGGALPGWEPGAHLSVHLPNGVDREYSLCGDPAVRNSYSIAVRLAEPSRGGSRWLHDHAHTGQRIDISGPGNHFRLVPAQRYLFIAAGIGITPIKTMIESLPASKQWELVYLGRTRAAMPYLDRLESKFPDRVIVHARDEHPNRLDLAALLAARSAETEVYVCGPEQLLSAATDLVPARRLHLERFSPSAMRNSAEPARAVDITCGRSGKEIHVPAGVSVLHALQEHAIPIVGSCGEGLCGTCEVRVLRGTPEHLDSIRNEQDKNIRGIMYPCVSRSLSATLVLDI
ncbi:Phenoxybenzoate dioxygenase subunit beta [Arthrobacter sp. SO5]|uniref:2Fe-2S iron-sulfur cluster-binding protein n=1 Tax=Arthrobacter sp. SO5 TaxID=1897055 RepID=UPI001E57BD5F|nr:2Fe-2S iron-sulfur cluster-binding protein [Arthrobacter sp. SO5]MCB5275351.1 Phenoxybenzoate dioxygenase subunit beta [Arthrobacter sp. SO5]